ncbi:MAG TPA: hypothetical protein VF535_04760 [Allosphingosinicella sp.]|jgi:hypothetical protein
MIGFLLLAAAAQAPATAPTPAEVASAQEGFRREAEEGREAIDSAIRHRLLARGDFSRITDAAEQRSAARRFEKRLRSLGIAASVGECRWMGLVAEGTATGNRSYGGACMVKIGARRASDFLICEADLGSVTLVKPDWFAWDSEYIETFIRRTCI